MNSKAPRKKQRIQAIRFLLILCLGLQSLLGTAMDLTIHINSLGISLGLSSCQSEPISKTPAAPEKDSHEEHCHDFYLCSGSHNIWAEYSSSYEIISFLETGFPLPYQGISTRFSPFFIKRHKVKPFGPLWLLFQKLRY
jgi:hypothetical protein